MRMRIARILGVMAAVSALSLLAVSQTEPGCLDAARADSAECQSTQLNGAGNQAGSGTVDAPVDATVPNAAAQAGATGQEILPAAAAKRVTKASDAESQDTQAKGLVYVQQRQEKPEPPTEFQQFVSASTGTRLQIYGAELFRNLPRSFVPSDQAPVPADYVIAPDDELRVRIWGQVTYSGNLRVDRGGNIYLSQAGEVHVAGLTYAQLDGHLRQALARVYRNFDLSVDVGRIRSMQVYVTGQARRPGAFTVSSLSTLVDALFVSGGPSAQGSLRHIELRREGKTVTDFDLYALLARGDKSGDAHLLPEDVIYIAPAGPQVALTGSVRNAAIYELRQGETLGDLLQLSGGLTALASNSRVNVERADGAQHRVALELALDAEGKAARLADGDLLRVFAILPAFQQTVTLRGNVANPGHFAYKPGMRLSDILPDRDALMSRDYWWKRAHLGLPAPEFEPSVQPVAPLTTSLKQGISTSNSLSADQKSSFGSLADQTRRAAQAAFSTEQVDVNAQAQPLKQNEVRLWSPEIDWNYAVIERLDAETLKTTLLPFDPGALVLRHEAAEDLELKPGDVVTLFSQADISVPLREQTKYITLEGEIAHAGTYSVQPGETLREVLRRAGGLTTDAYLYGAQLTRESTRLQQQQRIDEYVQAVDLEMRRGAMALASYAISTGSTASMPTNSNAQDQFLARLKQMRASGRVVLQIVPESKGLDGVPDIALENGDRFIVPSAPGTINVVGAVYNQNSFRWQNGVSAQRYLQLAGGPNRNADRGRIYVIRADGSVLNRDTKQGYWLKSYLNTSLYPGDTLIVPDKNLRPSTGLKTFMDWTQSLSQMGMTAATISLLK